MIIYFLDQIDKTWPHWFVTHGAAELSNDQAGGLGTPLTAYQLFMARAWILKDDPKKLVQHIDISAAARGDFFFMHKLAETIKAFRRSSETSKAD